MSSKNSDPEAVVIGGGPGGYTAAIRLSQLDIETVLVEKGEIGGVCLNWGCIPTKALYSATEPLSREDSWKERGVNIEDISVQLDVLKENKNNVVAELTGGVEKILKSNGVKVLEGRAELRSGREVTVQREGGNDVTLRPGNVIIATGSGPAEVPGFSLDDSLVWSSREALQLEEIPEKLLILGAGVIGLEMANIYNRLGSEVEIVELLDSILPTLDLDRKPKALLARSLKKDGISLNTGWKAKELREDGGRGLVDIVKDEEEKTLEADKVLLAVGRKPLTDGINEGLGLEMTEEGYVEVDETTETNVEGIYAVGDVAGPPLLAHKASRQGLMAAASVAGEEVEGYSAMPSAIFTDPEFASVGMSEAKAREEIEDVKTGSFPLRASGKAIAMDEKEGMIKLLAEGKTGEVLGGQILSPHASDMISEVALAVEKGLTVGEIAGTIHPHPTLSEAVMEAAENSLGRSIHVTNR